MREKIIDTLTLALKDNDDVLALWEQGSTAFGRTDSMSDLDLHLLVRDNATQKVAEAFEAQLNSISSIQDRYIVPQPTWHGHWQGFFRLQGSSPFLIIDVVILKESSTHLHTEPEIHGEIRVLFDKASRLRKENICHESLKKHLVTRLADINSKAQMFHLLVDKEIARGRYFDATLRYQTLILNPLVEALRIVHCPERYNFGLRYLEHDLPKDISVRLKRFFSILDLDELKRKKTESLNWLLEVLEGQL